MTQTTTIDFETYFDQDYSLRKMTTEGYVRDARFKTHCLGITRGEHPGVLKGEWLTPTSLACLSGSALIAHHAHFDGLVLSHHYGVKPMFWFDTLSMARLLFPHAKSHSLKSLAALCGLQDKSVPYDDFKGVRELPPDLYRRVADGCKTDLELTHALFKIMAPYVPKSELRLIDLTVRMFTEPALRLNPSMLHTYLRESRDEKEALLTASGITREDANSAAKFSQALANLGVPTPTKISKKTGKVAPALAKTDEGLKELLEHPDKRVSTLVEARLGIKSNMAENRAQRLIEMDANGPMCVYLKYYGAHTGRWSGGDLMNWQNFTRGSVLRTSITAPEGHVIVVIDSAQIECRMLNWLAGQEDVLEAFRTGRDLYSEGASRFYGREITKANKLERHLGKTLELGCGYGMGAPKFQATCKGGALGGPPIILTDVEARSAVDSYRSSHRKVKALWRIADGVLEQLLNSNTSQWGPTEVRNKRIFYPNGSWSDYTHLTHDGEDFYTTSRKGKSKMYGAKLVENVVQALSRLVLAEAMLQISKKYRIVTCTHDEVVYLARAEEAQEALDFGMAIMKTPAPWATGLPLDAEGGHAINYSK